MPLFGWTQCDGGRFKYERCSFSASCLGARNTELSGKFEDEDGNDLALTPAFKTNGSGTVIVGCGPGYSNGSRLCHSCEEGFSHEDMGGKCSRCPETSANQGLVAAAALGAEELHHGLMPLE